MKITINGEEFETDEIFKGSTLDDVVVETRTGHYLLSAHEMGSSHPTVKPVHFYKKQR